MEIKVSDLFHKIGVLVVENDALREEVAALTAALIGSNDGTESAVPQSTGKEKD